jgi:cell volume regulation protein A
LITSSIDIYTAGIAGVVVIGFIGDMIARKSHLPSIVWLLAFGLVLGPVFGILKNSLLVGLSPIVSTIVLLIVVFNAGLKLNIYQFIRSISRTMLLAVVNFVIAAAITAAAAYIFGFSLIDGILLGVIVGGTSAAVIPIISKGSSLSPQAKNLVTVESILTDPIGIVLTLAIINIIILNNYSLNFVVSSVISSFSISLVMGAVAGFIWIPIMGYLQRDRYEYSYAGALAVAFIIFLITQALNGSGPIAALVFGIMIANGEEIFKWLKYKDTNSFTLNSESRRFNNLITFFTAAFFFVYLGALVSFSNYSSMLIGLGITVLLIVSRFIGTPVALFKSQYQKEEMPQISTMVSRGMGAGVLATLPLAYGVPGTAQFINIIFMVILASILFNSAAAFFFASKKPKVTVSPKAALSEQAKQEATKQQKKPLP